MNLEIINPIATFETFEDLNEFLNSVELNDGYEIVKNEVKNPKTKQLNQIILTPKIKPKFIIED